MNTLIALACAGWLTVPNADPPNTLPLAYGMTRQDVANALGTPLIHVRGRRGSEVLYAERPARTPGLYQVDHRIWLQFRRGCLTGWKGDWDVAPHWPF